MKKAKKRFKLAAVVLSLALVLGLAACGGSQSSPESTPVASTGQSSGQSEVSSTAEGAGGNVKISFLNSKGGPYVEPLEAMAAQYKEQTGVEIEILNTPDGGSPFERISTLYSSGNPPTIAMLDPTDVVAIAPEKGLDLSGEKWVADAGTMAGVVDGVVYGFPFCVEAKGLLYNKSVIDNATGGDFDPASIQNINDLQALFDELQDAGVQAPMMLMKEDWSLGAHFLQLVYESQGNGTADDIAAFIEELKAGQVDLMSNDRFNQYMDTFDILAQYNYKSIVEGDPMGGDNVQDAMNFAEGETAFYFNGNWVWADLKDYADEGAQFGMMPLPTNAANDDFTNTSLEAWSSKHLMIDKEKSTPEQQQAALDFLNWLVYDEDGQSFIVNDMNLVPAFGNNTLAPTDPLGQSISQYVASGNVFASAVVPGDHWATLGATMQKYLSGLITRADLAAEIEAYWVAQAAK